MFVPSWKSTEIRTKSNKTNAHAFVDTYLKKSKYVIDTYIIFYNVQCFIKHALQKVSFVFLKIT